MVGRNESIEWGTLRTGRVEIGGTDYISEVPNKELVQKEIAEILQIENETEIALKE